MCINIYIYVYIIIESSLSHLHILHTSNDLRIYLHSGTAGDGIASEQQGW